MGRRPHRPAVCLGLAAAVTVSLVSGAGAARADVEPPDRMAALGDSITRGFHACGLLADCTSRSWSTGLDNGVNSHYQRLRTRNPKLTVHNDAATGAKVAALKGQAEQAVAQRAQYVTVLIGANDACTRTEAEMTSVADFETRFRAAMKTLRAGVPDARIFVASVPDLRRLWAVAKDNVAARTTWRTFGICQSMLARPLSTSAADTDRRRRVRQRVIAYNAVLAEVCAENPRCRYDDDAVFSYRFTFNQVSRWDYFHPNTAGQNVLARVTYARSFWPATAGVS
ncbi:MAG TPA: GDSL-type esterase/lipase family protein [Thermomonospora sp.]|nr:GDSL-type esterase/lipase family protein [Thermomonospora sp.]